MRTPRKHPKVSFEKRPITRLMSLLKSFCTALIVVSFLAGCSGQGVTISSNQNGESSKVQISTDGVKVETHGQDGATSQVAVTGQGVQVNSDKAGQTSQVNVSGQGVQVDTTDGAQATQVNVGAQGVEVSGDAIKGVDGQFGVAALEHGENTQITVDGQSVQVTGHGGRVDVSVDESAVGDAIVISGASQERVIDANGRKVVISGAANDITITGNCPGLVVSGSANEVEIESCDNIVVSGTGNEIEYEKGNPRIVDSGTGNVISRS